MNNVCIICLREGCTLLSDWKEQDAFRRPVQCQQGCVMASSWTSFSFHDTKCMDLPDAFKKPSKLVRNVPQNNAEFPLFHRPDKWIWFKQHWCIEWGEPVHQMDLYPAVSMLHVMFYAVKSFSLKKRPALVWTGLYFEIYVVFGWIRQAYLTDHRLRASSMSTGYFNMQDCLVRQIHLNTRLTWLISKFI